MASLRKRKSPKIKKLISKAARFSIIFYNFAKTKLSFVDEEAILHQFTKIE